MWILLRHTRVSSESAVKRTGPFDLKQRKHILLSFFKTLRVSPEGTGSRAHRLEVWAQLFEGRLVLNPGLNLTQVSFSFVQKHFLGQFSLIFIEHRIIILLTKRTKLNLLYKLSYLNSNFALTLGYLNPALNNPALVYNGTH